MNHGVAPDDPLPIAPIGRPLDASIRVPGSKSLALRHLVAAATTCRMRSRAVVLEGAPRCDDVEHAVAALVRLGVTCAWRGGALHVGAGCAPVPESEPILGLGDGGAPTRFLLAFAASEAHEVRGWIQIDGSPRLRERPIAEGVAMLRALGAAIEWIEADGRLPVRVRGGSLRGGRLEIGRTASSQFASALLLAGPSLRDGLEISFHEEPTSASYLELTLAALAEAGLGASLSVARDGGAIRAIRIAPNVVPAEAPEVLEIEPDASSAVYPAAAAVLSGGRVVLEGLPRGTLQPDRFFLDELARRGVQVEARAPVEGRGSIRVAAAVPVVGGDSDWRGAPDAAVMAMVLAAAAERPSFLTGLETLRVKESDRIAAVAAGLAALGGRVETGEDWARVHPLPPPDRSAGVVAIDPRGDHRVAMAFAILGLARPGIAVRHPGCVGKSWPGFWGALDLLRCRTLADNAGRP